jgi:broad specificity phosphatase PhoE
MTRKPHDLSHYTAANGNIGRLQTLSTTYVLPGDSYETDLQFSVRLSALKRGLTLDAKIDVCTFYMSMANIYDNWEDFIKEGPDETQTLATEAVGGQACSVLGGGIIRGPRQIAAFAPATYRAIWNNYFRHPTLTTERTDEPASWTDEENKHGFLCAPLKCPWTAFMSDRLDDAELTIDTTAGLNIAELDAKVAALKVEQRRQVWATRYREIISEMGGSTSIDRDERPRLIKRTSQFTSGYEIDGTAGDNLGQFSGRSVTSMRHYVPRYLVPEHGVIMTVALVRFPNVHQEQIAWWATNPNPSYTEISGDPGLFASQRPKPMKFDNYFNDGDSTVRGYEPFGNHLRYNSPVLTEDFDTLNGFPYQTHTPRSTQEAVQVSDISFDEMFTTQALGHWQIYGQNNITCYRDLPTPAQSIMLGVG